MPSATAQSLPDPTAEPTITAPRAAAILRISRRHAYMAIERGEIPCVRVGKRIVIPTARFLVAMGLDDAPRPAAPAA